LTVSFLGLLARAERFDIEAAAHRRVEARGPCCERSPDG
jgi:hypothetical protein